jgi:hypothetical protein
MPRLAEGQVLHLANPGATGIHGKAGAAEVIGSEVVDVAAAAGRLAHGVSEWYRISNAGRAGIQLLKSDGVLATTQPSALSHTRASSGKSNLDAEAVGA